MGRSILSSLSCGCALQIGSGLCVFGMILVSEMCEIVGEGRYNNVCGRVGVDLFTLLDEQILYQFGIFFQVMFVQGNSPQFENESIPKIFTKQVILNTIGHASCIRTISLATARILFFNQRVFFMKPICSMYRIFYLHLLYRFKPNVDMWHTSLAGWAGGVPLKGFSILLNH